MTIHPDIEASRRRARRREISRRLALAGGGSIALGTLLAACEHDDASPSTPRGSATTPAGAGGSAGSELKSATGSQLTRLLDQSSTCNLTPEETEGPYYIDLDKIRRDLREDRPGTRLTLGLRVQDADCQPLENAVVEIWHCDAGGIYSGFESVSRADGGGFANGGSSDDGTYLRGAQVTNEDGVASFVTIYPGWYPGRTVHIHFKVHVDQATVLTSQLYFDESVTDTVFATAPYNAHTGRDVTNESDQIFDADLVTDVFVDRKGQQSYLATKNLMVKA